MTLAREHGYPSWLRLGLDLKVRAAIETGGRIGHRGESEMVRVLIGAGADLEAVGRAAPSSGTALAHAVHYGIVPAVDLLVAADAVIHDLVEAAGAGSIEGFPAPTRSRSPPSRSANGWTSLTNCWHGGLRSAPNSPP